MSTTADLMIRPASDMPARHSRRPEPTFLTYELLQQGERDVSLQAILNENPMLGVTIAQQINSGSVEILDLAIDPSDCRLIDLQLRLRGRRTASSVSQNVALAESRSDVHVKASARAAVIHRVAGSDPVASADWTLHMLLRDLQDAHAAVDARLESGEDWEHFLDDHLSGANRPERARSARLGRERAGRA